jgi:lipopolysaccharide transport system permease protein
MKTHLYEPNKYLKLGIKIWPQMVKELIDSRELIVRLFIRDFSVKYRQSVLGNFWVIVMPFIAIGTFLYLNKAGIFKIEETSLPYPLFAFIGLSVWQIFSTGLNSGCNSLVSAGDMISRINFPREVLVISSMAQTIFEFLLKSIFMIIFLFIMHYVPHPTALFFPLSIIPLLLLTLGLSFLLSLLNGLLRDTAQMVSLLLTFLMFLTPVLYPISQQHSWLLQFNPLTPLITAPRDLIAYGYITHPLSYAIASIVSLLICLISWRIFHLVETKIPERI